MADNIIPYIEMCRREGTSLQQGMNFGLGGNHSVILMSVRRNAPYRDRLEDGGTTLIYEGHDEPRGSSSPNPKAVDQPEHYPSGNLTQNGKFHKAAQNAKAGQRQPERVRVYEKIHVGIWSYNGIFHLIDS
ncbi:MAG: HNH endonuclease, partial [candidate division NC10 bacterium]|nr:HNH endonuclease [candidate division NC10 bacterium]